MLLALSHVLLSGLENRPLAVDSLVGTMLTGTIALQYLGDYALLNS